MKQVLGRVRYKDEGSQNKKGDLLSKHQNKLAPVQNASPLLGGRVQGLANPLRPSLPGDKEKNSETLCGES